MTQDNNPFSGNTVRYEQWYDKHPAAYQSELNAIRYFWPTSGVALEVGAGAGHFAAPLGIGVAVES